MTNPQVNPSRSEGEIHLLDYVLVLAKHSRRIVYTGLLVFFLTFLVLFLFPNQYTATARIMPPQQNSTLSGQILDSLSLTTLASSGGGGGLGGLAAGMLGLKSPGDQYLGIIMSDTIFDRIIKRFNLKKVYDEEYIEDARKELSKHAKIETTKEGLISIEVTNKDPKVAAEMANAFAEELDKHLQAISRQDALNQMAFLDREREQATLNLARAEEALRHFSEEKSVLQLEAQAKGMIEYVAGLRAAIDAKEVQIQVLRQQAAPRNYDLILLNTELKGLREKLQAAESKADQACVGEICISTGKMPSLGMEFIRLYREVKYQETLYQLYVRLVEIARMDTVRNFATISFVDQATVPEKRSWPPRLLISFILSFVATFLMVVIAFLLEYMQYLQSTETNSPRLALLHSYLEPWKHKVNKVRSLFQRKKL